MSANLLGNPQDIFCLIWYFSCQIYYYIITLCYLNESGTWTPKQT